MKSKMYEALTSLSRSLEREELAESSLLSSGKRIVTDSPALSDRLLSIDDSLQMEQDPPPAVMTWTRTAAGGFVPSWITKF